MTKLATMRFSCSPSPSQTRSVGLAAAVAVCCGVSFASAQTIVGGFIEASTEWTADMNPILVESSILLTNGAVLSIGPGVEVRFLPNRGIVVEDATFMARGTGQEPITLRPELKGDDTEWGGIWFGEDAANARFDDQERFIDGSILEHTVISGVG